MSLQLTGKLKEVFQEQTFPSGFTKREFVITTDEQYPQDVKFELIKDKTALIDKYETGQSVTVSFNVRGSFYNGKYYVSLQAWRIESAPPQNQSAPPATQSAPPAEEDTDLPF
jgi:hypothetical protein